MNEAQAKNARQAEDTRIEGRPFFNESDARCPLLSGRSVARPVVPLHQRGGRAEPVLARLSARLHPSGSMLRPPRLLFRVAM